MIKVETRCGCGAEVVVKAAKSLDDELVLRVRTTWQYTEKRESLRQRVEKGQCRCPENGAAGLIQRCPVHDGADLGKPVDLD